MRGFPPSIPNEEKKREEDGTPNIAPSFSSQPSSTADFHLTRVITVMASIRAHKCVSEMPDAECDWFTRSEPFTLSKHAAYDQSLSSPLTLPLMVNRRLTHARKVKLALALLAA